MPLPAFVSKIKIHPAIGFARLSTNSDDPYIFGETHPQQSYKSNGLMRRQAVRFKLFGQNDDGSRSEELSLEDLRDNGVEVIWRCSVANSKISRQTGDNFDRIEANARSDQSDGQLVGALSDFHGASEIPLGRIHSDGVFEPPVSMLYRRHEGESLPVSGMTLSNFADNTSDGTITVILRDISSGARVEADVFPAWIAVAPPDFAPETDGHYESESQGKNLIHYMFENLGYEEHSTPTNATARQLDRSHLRRGAGHFAPGIEVDRPRRNSFYAADELGDTGEVRVSLSNLANPARGQLPGQMTEGLCSPWQGDFKACTCSHWVAHRPDTVVSDEGTGAPAKWLRRISTDVGLEPDAGQISHLQEWVDHVDKLGIVRGDNSQNPDEAPEHERGDGDDVPTV